jgi:hypothetical protein
MTVGGERQEDFLTPETEAVAAVYDSFNQHWHKCQSGRADLLVSQKAAQQRRPTMPMRQCCFDLP